MEEVQQGSIESRPATIPTSITSSQLSQIAQQVTNNLEILKEVYTTL